MASSESSPDPSMANIDPALLDRRPAPTRVQPKPPCVAPKLTDAQKASRKTAAQASAIKMHELAIDLEAFLVDQDAKIQVLAARYSVKRDYIEQQINHQTNYKKTRAPSLSNAITHHKAMEENKNRGLNDKLDLAAIKELVKDDPELQPENLSKERKAELIAELVEYREEKKSGVRLSSKSVAQDLRVTTERLNNELGALAERTGSSSFFFVTRGNVRDASQPSWYSSGDSIDFFTQVLTMNPWDTLRQFEQWACSRAKGTRFAASIVCAACLLCAICNKKKVIMNYKNYDRAVVIGLGVRLDGWTYHDLVQPSEISSIVDLRALQAAIRCGACKWTKLSPREIQAHEKLVAEKEAAGIVVGQKRSSRKDKGVPRP
ncbi:hypothetical protein BV25DRAFT_1766711, partial [Artomyces pyxidatus]